MPDGQASSVETMNRTLEMATVSITGQERNWSIWTHISGLAILAGIPFGNVAGPLIVYSIKRDQSPFIAGHAKAALNFQLTMLVPWMLILIALMFCVVRLFSIGGLNPNPDTIPPDKLTPVMIPMMIAICANLLLYLLEVVMVVLAVNAAGAGRLYRYPLAIGFLR